MINRIYNTLKFFSNNQMQGNVTPTEYNVALYNRINDIYDDLFLDLNRYINRENRGLITNGQGDLPKKIREKIAHYLTKEGLAVAGGSITIPEDHRFTDLLVNSDNGRPIQDADSAQHFYNVKTVRHTAPSAQYPIALREGETYSILPATTGVVLMYYLRNPVHPNWTYTVVDGKELYNPSDASFQDVDIHPSEEFNLTLLVLKSFGINLKEEQLIQATQSEEMKEFQKQNSQ